MASALVVTVIGSFVLVSPESLRVTRTVRLYDVSGARFESAMLYSFTDNEAFVTHDPFPTLYSIFERVESDFNLTVAVVSVVSVTDKLKDAYRGMVVKLKLPEADPVDGDTLLLHELETTHVFVPFVVWFTYSSLLHRVYHVPTLTGLMLYEMVPLE